VINFGYRPLRRGREISVRPNPVRFIETERLQRSFPVRNCKACESQVATSWAARFKLTNLSIIWASRCCDILQRSLPASCLIMVRRNVRMGYLIKKTA
jgi:hypothetical protein